MLAIRSLIFGLLSPLVGTFAIAGGLLESDHSIVARQNGAVNGNICATLDIALLGITVVRGTCICAQAGVLTPASILAINQQVTANQGLLAPVINLVGGLAGAITTVTSNALPLVLAQPTSCRYPANATPNACGSCGYACFSNSTITYVECGSSCILAGAPCISGVPGRRRDIYSRDLSFNCAVGYEACLIPGRPSKGSVGYECIDTASDLESCGGCIKPFTGRPTGEDCSAIPNVASTSCATGECVVHSCLKGYELLDGACIKLNGRPFAGYWEALRDGSRVVLSQ